MIRAGIRAALCTLAALVALVVASPRAHAGGCVIDSVGSFSVVGYDVLAASPNDSTGSVTYKCLLSLGITIDISTGAGTYAMRTMARTGGGTALGYNLFYDSARTQVWGDGTGTTTHYGPVIGLLVDTKLTIYGRVFAGQDVLSGSFGENVVVTLNY